MNRRERAALAAQTVAIVDRGRYQSPSGQDVDLSQAMDEAQKATITYLPTDPIAPAGKATSLTSVDVINETSLEGAKALTGLGCHPGVLNFASAKNPGGGYLSGALAQEESLARASGLARLLDGNPMYAENRAKSDPFYTDHVIFTPKVPVFRTDSGTLLDAPMSVSFVTAPAVNAGVVTARAPHRTAEIETVMVRRVHRVLGTFAQNGCRAIVLGAWGCGVFRNDPALIARLFVDALAGPFESVFSRVRFSVLDSSDLQFTIRPFREACQRLAS